MDLVITKSVSRFARNVVDFLGMVRMLSERNPPIGVFFEAENIFSLNETCLLDLLRIMGLLCGLKLFPCSAQSVFILRDGFLLNVQLFTQQRQLGGQARHTGIHVLDARRGQLEPALGKADLLAESRNAFLYSRHYHLAKRDAGYSH